MWAFVVHRFRSLILVHLRDLVVGFVSGIVPPIPPPIRGSVDDVTDDAVAVWRVGIGADYPH